MVTRLVTPVVTRFLAGKLRVLADFPYIYYYFFRKIIIYIGGDHFDRLFWKYTTCECVIANMGKYVYHFYYTYDSHTKHKSLIGYIAEKSGHTGHTSK